MEMQAQADLTVDSVPQDINQYEGANRLSQRPEITPSGQVHITFLDGIRGFAALYVCLSHVWVYHDDHALSAAERVMRFLMGGGHSAVNVFIVLSGYCLMLPFLNGKAVDAKNFFLMRALRILPPYFLCLMVSATLGATVLSSITGSGWDDVLPVNTTNVLAHVFLIHDWFKLTSEKVNYVFWSIGVEWKIYFLFPALVLLGRRFGFMRTAFVAYISTFLLWMVLFHYNWLNPVPAGSSVYYIGLFTAGMATAVWIESRKRSGVPINLKAVLVGIVITSIGVFEIEFKHATMTQIGSFFGGILACLWIVWLSTAHSSVSRRALSSRPAALLGKISFSLYLVHPLILQLVWVFVLKEQSSWSLPRVALAYCVSVGGSLIAGYIFYLIIEAPSIGWTRWAKKLGRNSSTGVAQAPV